MNICQKIEILGLTSWGKGCILSASSQGAYMSFNCEGVYLVVMILLLGGYKRARGFMLLALHFEKILAPHLRL